jgi:hypothetical protein
MAAMRRHYRFNVKVRWRKDCVGAEVEGHTIVALVLSRTQRIMGAKFWVLDFQFEFDARTKDLNTAINIKRACRRLAQRTGIIDVDLPRMLAA